MRADPLDSFIYTCGERLEAVKVTSPEWRELAAVYTQMRMVFAEERKAEAQERISEYMGAIHEHLLSLSTSTASAGGYIQDGMEAIAKAIEGHG